MQSKAAITAKADAPWRKTVLIAAGLVWIGRAALEIAFRPDYWDPRTAVDYTAVAGFSLALILLACGLWAIHRSRKPQTGLRKWLWLLGIGLACGGALLAGAANFLEDWLSLKALSEAFIWGSLATFAGLLLAGFSAFEKANLSSFEPAVGGQTKHKTRPVWRWTHWLLIACAIGLGLMDSGGGFIIGAALLLLGVLPQGQIA